MDALSEQSVIDTLKAMKCDGYTKVNEVNMRMIDTQNKDVCDRYRK